MIPMANPLFFSNQFRMTVELGTHPVDPTPTARRKRKGKRRRKEKGEKGTAPFKVDFF
jgi:hypothetical protein